MWSDWLAFCDCGFHFVCPPWRRIRGLWKLPDGRDWLRGKLGRVLMGGAMFCKSLIQFYVEGQDSVLSLLFDPRPNYGGGNEDNGDLLQKVPCTHCHTQCPQPCSRPPLTEQQPPPETPGSSRASLGQPLVGPLLLSPGSWCIQGCLCPPRVCFHSPM